MKRRVWNSFCWNGVLHAALQNKKKLIQAVLSASESPLKNSDDPMVRDTLAVARALRGIKAKRKLAIQDFQFCIEQNHYSESHKARCQKWIGILEQNQDPFTPEDLENLMSQAYYNE